MGSDGRYRSGVAGLAAGLRDGDVLTTVNGLRIADYGDILRLIQQSKPAGCAAYRCWPLPIRVVVATRQNFQLAVGIYNTVQTGVLH